MLLPFVLGSSPHLPVSVCGTGIYIQDLYTFLASVILGTSLVYQLSLSVRVFPLPRLVSSPASVNTFYRMHTVQESLPAIHRLRLPASP